MILEKGKADILIKTAETYAEPIRTSKMEFLRK